MIGDKSRFRNHSPQSKKDQNFLAAPEDEKRRLIVLTSDHVCECADQMVQNAAASTGFLSQTSTHQCTTSATQRLFGRLDSALQMWTRWEHRHGGTPVRTLPKRAYLSVACRWNQHPLAYSATCRWNPHPLAYSATCRRNPHPFHPFSNLEAEPTPVSSIQQPAGGINSRSDSFAAGCLLPKPMEATPVHPGEQTGKAQCGR